MNFKYRLNIQAFSQIFVMNPINFVFCSCTFIALIFFSCVSESSDVSDDNITTFIPAMTVTIAIPREVNWPITLNVYGVITPWQEANISAQIGGYQIIDVFVNVGDVVKKGQILASFDRSLLLADQAELIANVEQAAANLQQVNALQNGNTISEKDVLQAQTQAKIADAALAKNQLQVKYTHVLAPDNGVISARSATLGAVPPVGQELFQMIRQQRLEWRGEVTPSQFHRIKTGQTVRLALPDGTATNAIIRQKSPLFDNGTRLATVYADIFFKDQAVAGMYVAGSVELGNSNAIVVPAKSVIIRDGRNYVLSVSDLKNTAKVSLRAVSIGRRYGTEVEIISSLDNVEHVVVKGAGFLSDGDMVRIVNAMQNSGVK